MWTRPGRKWLASKLRERRQQSIYLKSHSKCHDKWQIFMHNSTKNPHLWSVPHFESTTHFQSSIFIWSFLYHFNYNRSSIETTADLICYCNCELTIFIQSIFFVPLNNSQAHEINAHFHTILLISNGNCINLNVYFVWILFIGFLCKIVSLNQTKFQLDFWLRSMYLCFEYFDLFCFFVTKVFFRDLFTRLTTMALPNTF